MLENLNGLFVIGVLSKKWEDEYEKEGQKYKSYTLKFDYMGGSHTIKTDDVVYTKVEQGSIYAIEVKTFTNEKLKFATLLNNKNNKVYELTDAGFTDLF